MNGCYSYRSWCSPMRRVSLPEPANVSVDVADQLIAEAESLLPKNRPVPEDPQLLQLCDSSLQRLVHHFGNKSKSSEAFKILYRNVSPPVLDACRYIAAVCDPT